MRMKMKMTWKDLEKHLDCGINDEYGTAAAFYKGEFPEAYSDRLLEFAQDYDIVLTGEKAEKKAAV